jgi:hypothetical protein
MAAVLIEHRPRFQYGLAVLEHEQQHVCEPAGTRCGARSVRFGGGGMADTAAAPR